MQTYYSGDHSVIFGDLHSWRDLRLVPIERPHVEPPTVKTNVLEIPGMNGNVNLSNIPLGFPTFNTRTGSWTFRMAHDVSEEAFEIAYTKILNALHGKQMIVILEDDRNYYYEGLLTLGSPSPDQSWTDLEINYEFQPYKKMIWTTLEDWDWDPFDFRYGEIPQSTFKNIRVDSDTYSALKQWTQDHLGSMPITPTFHVTSDYGQGLTIAVHNVNYGNVKYFSLPDGEYTDPNIMFACPNRNDVTRLMFKGHGYVSIEFRPGRL